MDGFKLLIDGRLVEGAATMDVVNPATEEVLAVAPRGSAAQMEQAIAAAKAAFPKWAATPLAERRKVLAAIGEIIEAHVDEIARLLTQEQGKPLKNATMETRGAGERFKHYAGRELPVEVLEDSETRRVEMHRKPLGVVGAIVPWNFPLGMMSWKVPPSLLVGNTVVLKPAPTTPLATLRIGELISQVVPPGVVNIVTDDNDLGALLASHPDVHKVSFTGSVATGRKVMAGAAPSLKHVTLELGGNDAAIVTDDVDPKAIAQKLFAGAFGNSGQVCVAIKRLYVHAAVYDEVCDELAKIASTAVVGDGLQQGTEFGPIQNKKQFERVKELIEDARKAGKVITGDSAVEGPGYFVRPTIVRDIDEGVRLVDEEQFGPVLPVLKFEDDEEALARANATAFGLGGSIWSSDPARAMALADRMEAGMVWVNTHGGAWNHIPFGGAKQSGLGWELGREGLDAYSQLKVVNIAR
jgi:acyl-CoA reductase-like NAD-dependent aldehyde dehydrogenase